MGWTKENPMPLDVRRRISKALTGRRIEGGHAWCSRCGEQGHSARECENEPKVARSHEPEVKLVRVYQAFPPSHPAWRVPLRSLLTLALLFCSSCAMSVLGDAKADCYRLERILSELGERCGGHAIAATVLSCEDVLESGMTSGRLDDCEAWARAASCEEVSEKGWHAPDVCSFQIVHTGSITP